MCVGFVCTSVLVEEDRGSISLNLMSFVHGSGEHLNKVQNVQILIRSSVVVLRCTVGMYLL